MRHAVRFLISSSCPLHAIWKANESDWCENIPQDSVKSKGKEFFLPLLWKGTRCSMWWERKRVRRLQNLPDFCEINLEKILHSANITLSSQLWSEKSTKYVFVQRPCSEVFIFGFSTELCYFENIATWISERVTSSKQVFVIFWCFIGSCLKTDKEVASIILSIKQKMSEAYILLSKTHHHVTFYNCHFSLI